MSDARDQADTSPEPTTQLLPGVPNDANKAQRRVRERYRFQGVQQIAVREGTEIPRDHAFFEVQCYDLSQTGFAFLFANPPSFKRLVIALGTPENVLHVGAEVVHSTAVQYYRSFGSLEAIDDEARQLEQAGSFARSGRRMFLIGCRFTDRF